MTYTRTKEKRFSTIMTGKEPADAVESAWARINAEASAGGYGHVAKESVAISVKMVDKKLFHADAKATFAKVVPADYEEDDE